MNIRIKCTETYTLESREKKSKHSPPAFLEIKASVFFSLPLPPILVGTLFSLISSEVEMIICIKKNSMLLKI